MADGFPIPVIWPFGPAKVEKPSHSSGTYTIDPVDNSLIAVENQVNLTGNATLALANVNPDLPVGSKVRLKVTADGSNRTLSFGSNITGNNVTVSSGTTEVVTIEKLDSGFYVVGNQTVA